VIVTAFMHIVVIFFDRGEGEEEMRDYWLLWRKAGRHLRNTWSLYTV